LSSSGTTGIGEAPQLPCGSTPTSSCSTYAEYDDGASVFNNYQNWKGTNNPTGWSVTSSSMSVTINNGLTLSTTGPNACGYTQEYGFNTPFNLPYVAEEYAQITAKNTGCNWSWMLGFFGDIGNNYAGQISVSAGTDKYPYFSWYNLGDQVSSIQWSLNKFYILSILAGQSVWYPEVNYISLATVSASVPSNRYIVFLQDPGASLTAYWWRTRAYPPGGIMPSASFG
jgi:hypothetical protein